MGATDQRVDVALLGLGVQIDAIFRKRAFAPLAAAALAIGAGSAARVVFVLEIAGAGNGTGLAVIRVLGHAVRDEIHRVIAGHVLLLQKERRV